MRAGQAGVRGAAASLATCFGLLATMTGAHAQIMPSPGDVAITPWDRQFERGPCGFTSSEDDYAIYSLQEAYERAGRCDEYGQTFDRDGDKIVWINYLTETPAPHSFQGFFAHYDLAWWDGYVPPRIKGTQYDSGQPSALADPRTGRAPSARGAVCGLSVTDDLSGALQGFLSANDMCSLYSAARYDHFIREVPAAQRYAVNYVAWVAGEPLLPADQAAALDVQYLGEASLSASARTSAREPSVPRLADTASPGGPPTGACGFPVRTPEQRSGQDILAKMDRCDE